MKAIPVLMQRIKASKPMLVDDDDYDALSKLRWREDPNGYARFAFYEQGKARSIAAHRLILGARPGEQVDHINGKKLDNRRSNIRLCTGSQNQFNRSIQKNNQSGFKGVRINKGFWEGRIKANGQEYHIGFSRNVRNVVVARSLFVKLLHEEFAKTQ